MNIEELAGKCVEALNNQRDVQLVIPRVCRGKRITLAGRGTPMSVDMMWNPNCPDQTVAWFRPAEILGWLKREGMIEIQAETNESIEKDKPQKENK